MAQFVSQRIIFRISSQRHSAELRLKPPKTQFNTRYRSDVRLSFCQFRSDLAENLVDNLGCFWCSEEQMSSNLHREVFRRGEGASEARHGDQGGLLSNKWMNQP